AHTHRKAVFLACLDSPGVAALVDAVDASWEHRESRWQPGQHVRVFDEAVEILGDTVLTWARVEPRPGPGAAPDLATMVEGFGSSALLHDLAGSPAASGPPAGAGRLGHQPRGEAVGRPGRVPTRTLRRRDVHRLRLRAARRWRSGRRPPLSG